MLENYKLTIMKELSIEEKAKRYELALERCRKLYNEAKANEYISDIEDYETIFPELTENNNDEKIRKVLVKYFKSYKEVGTCGAETFNGIPTNDVINWLEKQGTKESNKMSIWKHWKYGIAGNGEGKPIYLVKIGNTYSLNSCLGFECDYIELSELDKMLSEKQGTSYTKRDVDDAYVEGMAFAKNELEKQKSSWSEDDEKMKDLIISVLEVNHSKGIFKVGLRAIRTEEIVSWLKSLKQRHTWKPTEEQMKALDSAIDEFDGYQEFGSLVSLKKDLEKLKRE